LVVSSAYVREQPIRNGSAETLRLVRTVEMKTKSQLNWKVQLAFGAAILTLLVVGAISYRSMIESGESDRWVRHSHEVLENLQDLRSAMDNIESSDRGFVLTGHEPYAESCQASQLIAEQKEATIGNLTIDNRLQQSRLPDLARLMAAKIQFAEMVINLRRAHGFEPAANAIRSGAGQRIMDEFQTLMGKMQDEELRLLALRFADAKRRLSHTKNVLMLGTLLGLLIAAGAGWSAQRDHAARVLAEDAQHVGEQSFSTLVNNISQLAWMADEKGSIFWYNQRWFDYTGTTLAEMAGWGWQKVHHPDHVQRVVDKIRHCFQTGEIWEDTFPLRGRDGSYRLFLSRAVPIRDPAGKVTRWFGTNTDISETKESGAKYRGLLEAAPDAMVVVNTAGEIVLLNVQAEKQLGYHRDELVGQPVTNIIPEGFAERLIADGTRTAAEALAQQIGTGIELIARRKDGSEFPIEIMLSPLESAEGILVTAAIRDISVRQAAETNLAQMEGRYRGLLEAAPDAMVVVNTAGEIVLLNVRAEKEFGYSRDELVGQKVKNIIPEGFAERLIADALRSTADALAQQIGTGIELSGRRKDGSEFPLEMMLSPLESAEGILVTAAIRDITTRKAAEADLLYKIAELNRSNEELGQFAYIASHDLQEPLRMVASYTQLLARQYKGKLGADADEFIGFAVDGANRMQRLIQDLLVYSRVGTKGKDLLDASSEDALQQALVNLRGAIEDSGAQVTHDPLPTVLADDMQLTQLFQNLIGNGIKYQNPGVPRVHISAAKNGGNKWTFSVKDNGLGIDPQYFGRIFGMFQRLHKREEFAGTGIGLAICKKIVERHGGSISVASQPGQGSTFSFALAASERKT
jgi:PAS domain S-box-containing protein